jgi:hypothetical protein
MKSYLFVLIATCFMLYSCTNDQKESVKTNPLEGVWEYVESFTPDTTYQRSPDMKAYKILYKDYFSLAGQNHPAEENWGHAGKIRVTEDTYVEYLDIVSMPAYVGDSAIFKYKLEGDIWTITYIGGTRTEKWKRVK